VYKKTTLSNGLRIASCRIAQMQSVSLGIWVKTGGRYENEKDKGVSHYLEHLLFKGSKKYSCRKIKETIEGLGGSLNGFTSEELSCFLVKIPGRFLNTALDILSDMVINPLLTQEDIDKERSVILEEIKMYKDQPRAYVHDLLDGLLWPNQPLGMPIIGFEDTVNNMSRSQICGFKEDNYSAANIVVSAAGILDHQRLSDKVKALAAKVKPAKENRFLPVKEKQREPQLKILHKDTEQSHLAMGFHSFKREHPLKYALSLLHVILGANMSSRLFNEVREKRGLAYEIGTQVKRLDDTGSFLVHAGVDNAKVEEALELILRELARMKSHPVPAAELKRAKDFSIGQLVLALEDTLEHMLWIGEYTASLNRIESPDEVIAQLNKVEATGIMRAAREIFDNKKLNLAAIGPLAGREDSIRAKLAID